MHKRAMPQPSASIEELVMNSYGLQAFVSSASGAGIHEIVVPLSVFHEVVLVDAGGGD
jgi:hypothetical protein